MKLKRIPWIKLSGAIFMMVEKGGSSIKRIPYSSSFFALSSGRSSVAELFFCDDRARIEPKGEDSRQQLRRAGCRGPDHSLMTAVDAVKQTEGDCRIGQPGKL